MGIEIGDLQICGNAYYQLGKLSQELGQFERAKINYSHAFRIWAEFHDENSLQEVFIPSIVHLYLDTQDESILALEELKKAIGLESGE
jgi:tetratricopeptide (TPR) repeat protein